MDLSIEVHDRKFNTKLFDKRDAFPFISIACHIWIAIYHLKSFYASISSEILRIARTTSELINMVTRVNLLLIRMKKQGSEYTRIILLLKKVFGKPFKVFHKFANTADEFIKLFSL